MGSNIHNGFTLLEVMIAILILTIGIVIVLQIFPLGFSVEKGSQMKSQAVLLAQEKIEVINSKAYQDIVVATTSEDSLASPFERFSRQTEISYVDADLQPSLADTGLKKIEVTVSWKSSLPLGGKTVTLITLVAEK